jgi:peroxiredoxin
MSGATAIAGLSLGDPLRAFGPLTGVDGQTYSLESFTGAAALVVVFASNGCPTVRLYQQRLSDLGERYSDRGVEVLIVNSNNAYLSPADTYEEMVERARRTALRLPYVKDEDGTLARTCGAVCTPHAFAFDQERRLRYRGRIDDSRTGRRVTRDDLGHALADMLAGRRVRVPETAPFGCAIVW